MAEQGILDSWKGQGVAIDRPGIPYPEFVRLEEVNEFGIVVRSSSRVRWGGYDDEGQHNKMEDRLVSKFYPWHLVNGFRLQEPEEHGGE